MPLKWYWILTPGICSWCWRQKVSSTKSEILCIEKWQPHKFTLVIKSRMTFNKPTIARIMILEGTSGVDTKRLRETKAKTSITKMMNKIMHICSGTYITHIGVTVYKVESWEDYGKSNPRMEWKCWKCLKNIGKVSQCLVGPGWWLNCRQRRVQKQFFCFSLCYLCRCSLILCTHALHGKCLFFLFKTFSYVSFLCQKQNPIL